MANHKSALKRIRQTGKRNLLNKSKKSRVRTAIKKLEEAITAGEKESAQKLFQDVQSQLGKLAKTGTFKKQMASRKTSRLAGKIAAL